MSTTRPFNDGNNVLFPFFYTVLLIVYGSSQLHRFLPSFLPYCVAYGYGVGAFDLSNSDFGSTDISACYTDMILPSIASPSTATSFTSKHFTSRPTFSTSVLEFTDRERQT